MQVTSANAASFFNLDSKGKIEVGCDADITLVDMKKEIVFSNESIVSLCGWTPYHGRKVTGAPVMTIVGGEIHEIRR